MYRFSKMKDSKLFYKVDTCKDYSPLQYGYLWSECAIYLTQDLSFKFKTGVSLVEGHQDGQGVEGFALGGRSWGFFNLEKVQLLGDLIVGGHREDGARLFTVLHDGRTRNNRQNLKQDKFRLDIRKNFFTVRAAKHWNRLLKVVQSLKVFKTTMHVSKLVRSHSWTCFEQKAGLDELQRYFPTWIILWSFDPIHVFCCLWF